MGTMSGGAETRAADCLRHPLVLLLIGIWIINDQFLKDIFGNAVTGKISDFAGVAVLPLMLLGAYESTCAALSKSPRFRHYVLLASIFITAVFMAGINIFDSWASVFRVALGMAQWPARAAWNYLEDGTSLAAAPVHHTMDPTDLWSLIALAFPFWLGKKTEPALES